MTAIPERTFDVDLDEYPFESHWWEREGSFMHYVDEGEGVPVIMCHGNPTWSFLYRNIIKGLAGECRSIAYDLPGFGFSDHPQGYGYTPQEHATWVEALITEHLQLERFILVVQDWGGPIGLSIATRHPHRVLGLVISSTWAWEAAMIAKVFSKLLGNPLGRRLILKKNIFARNLVPMILGSEAKKNPAVVDAYVAPFPTPESRIGTAVFPEQLTGVAPSLRRWGWQLDVLEGTRVEVIFGRNHLGTRPSDMATWLRYFPKAQVHKMPDANHFTQEDCPQQYVDSIRRILRIL